MAVLVDKRWKVLSVLRGRVGLCGQSDRCKKGVTLLKARGQGLRWLRAEGKYAVVSRTDF